MADTFVGWHELPQGDWAVVFKVGESWYWQAYYEDKKTPSGMARGPFPEAEGAYLSAIGD